jgi:4-hydroxybenzoate polyprenyltransferase
MTLILPGISSSKWNKESYTCATVHCWCISIRNLPRCVIRALNCYIERGGLVRMSNLPREARLGSATSLLSIPLLLLIEMRPRQWTKNLLVFAALIFSFKKTGIDALMKSFEGFVLFCIVSSCVYIINDYIDQESDRNHPVKKNRPLASGQLSPNLAVAAGIILGFTAMYAAYRLNVFFALILLAYFLLNLAYSLYLKHIVIIDVMTIAAGFMLRAVGGGIVINVSFTPWFLVCSSSLALFLALGKRSHELNLLQDKTSHRRVLDSYSALLLNQLLSIVTAVTLMSYCLFTFSSGHTIYFMWTIPFVLYGMFRYLYLIHVCGDGGSPEKILLRDWPILFTVTSYILLCVLILRYIE